MMIDEHSPNACYDIIKLLVGQGVVKGGSTMHKILFFGPPLTRSFSTVPDVKFPPYLLSF